MKLILKKTYLNCIINLISFIISCPRSAILIPSLLIFTFSYNVIYDFTIKELNLQLACHFGRSNILSYSFDPNIYRNELVGKLSNLNLQNKTLSNIVLTHSENVLTYDYLNEVEDMQLHLTQKFPGSVIISPLSSWPVNLSKKSGISNAERARFFNSLLKFLNYDQNSQLNYLFIDDIVKINHLIKYSKTLKLYIIHDLNYNMALAAEESIEDKKLVKVQQVHSTANTNSVKEFVNFYLIQNRSSIFVNLFITITNSIGLILIILFLSFVLLAISNEHKIRSNMGLLIGWVVEVMISCAASINFTTYIYTYKTWTLLFEPSTEFTISAYVLTVMILSSKNLFTIINELSDNNGFRNTNHDIHKRLYKLYLGLNQSTWINIPIITKNLFINILGLCILEVVGISIFYYFFEGNFLHYLTMRLTKLIQTIIIGLIFDHFLQLTYLVTIIIIDLNRYELTDILNAEQSNGFENVNVSKNEVNGVNLVSSFLLKLNSNSHLRPKRSSTRYKLGQFLLKIRYPRSTKAWLIILPLIELIYLLAVFMNWVIVIPNNLLNDSSELIYFDNLNILSNRNDCFYYMEFSSILLFIIATSLLIFKFTSSNLNSQSSKITSKLSKNDFEIDGEKKFFNSIELANPIVGHSLDVLKIKANSNSSFIVSMGMDHKILIWSPLNKPKIPKPINISTKIKTDGTFREFWPINHIDISNDGNYIMLINYKYNLIKCFERKKLTYIWECHLPDQFKVLIAKKKLKILESFFRRRTVPGYLARKILQRKKSEKQLSGERSRRDSEVSIHSANGNFPPPPISMKSINERQSLDESNKENEELERQLNKDDFTIVLETGDMITLSCIDGKLKVTNILSSVYSETELPDLKLTSVKKLSTPRVNDRIICQVNNLDIVIATVINNNWKFRKLLLREDYYNKGGKLVTPVSLSRTGSFNSFNVRHDFTSIYKHQKTFQEQEQQQENISTDHKMSNLQINKPIIVTVEFVGMIIRVKDLVAELIDIQSGIILKKFSVGYFKPSSFKVSHSEPTHCKFCGCASIQSFSILYEDFDNNTLIVHTFKIDIKRSKNNICLRVERDPREIRCLGFNAVSEHQYWYENIECWELTDINMIIGLKKRTSPDNGYEQLEEDIEKISPYTDTVNRQNINSLIENSGLISLRSRENRKLINYKPNKELQTIDKIWEGFIITILDGKSINYNIPISSNLKNKELLTNKVHCIEKFGFKSIILNFNHLIEIFYLGNDKLIENDLYYSGTNVNVDSIFEDNENDNYPREKANQVQPINSELLFINKRRRMRERSKHSQLALS